MRNLFILLSVVLVLSLGAGQAAGQFVWTKDSHNPVFSGGGTGAWDNDVDVPWVIFNSDSARYEMWYTGPSTGGGKIGFAVSSDGIAWTRNANPVLSPSPSGWDSSFVGIPCVMRENGQYKMWYSGARGASGATGALGARIGYATSADGRNWLKHPGNPVLNVGSSSWESGAVAFCSVIKNSGGYTMFYTGSPLNTNLCRIGRATSSDGITWQRDTLHNPVLNIGTGGAWDGNIYLPAVLNHGGTYYLWYTAEAVPDDKHPNIGQATSTDSGKTWVKYSKNPVLTPGTLGTWDERWVELGSVLSRGNTVHMWYDGGAPPANLGRVGHATSPLLGVRHRVPQDYSTIQAAINGAADGDTVLVSEGTYKENIRYRGKAIVVASLYLIDNDTTHITKTIIDGSGSTQADSGSAVSFVNGEDTTSVLCGFTIQGGTGTNYFYGTGTIWVRAGGGIYCHNSGARIARNFIRRNRILAEVPYGGGVECMGSISAAPYVILEGNLITDNYVKGSRILPGWWAGSGGADFTGFNARVVDNTFERDTVIGNTGASGGGMWFGNWPASPTLPVGYIAGNVFRSNVVTGTSEPAHGGGLLLQGTGQGTLVSMNLFIGNRAESPAGSNGGGIFLFGVQGTVTGNQIAGNWAGGGSSYGGGIGIDSSACRLENNIIRGNTSATRGGGVDVWGPPRQGTGQVLVNNTLIGNTAAFGGGLGVAYNAKVVSFNNIIWANSASSSGPSIYVVSATANVSYCDVGGGYPGTGNLDADPLFAVGDSLYNLRAASPCIGRGIDSLQDSGVWYRVPAYDFDGHSRHRPLGPQASDMGAQEEQITVDVEERADLPVVYGLSQNYPNPFNPTTLISYQLAAASEARLVVYDLLGREVAVLVNEKKIPGKYQVKFDASNLATGIYLYRLQAGDFVQTNKMLLLK